MDFPSISRVLKVKFYVTSNPKKRARAFLTIILILPIFLSRTSLDGHWGRSKFFVFLAILSKPSSSFSRQFCACHLTFKERNRTSFSIAQERELTISIILLYFFPDIARNDGGDWLRFGRHSFARRMEAWWHDNNTSPGPSRIGYGKQEKMFAHQGQQSLVDISTTSVFEVTRPWGIFPLATDAWNSVNLCDGCVFAAKIKRNLEWGRAELRGVL